MKSESSFIKELEIRAVEQQRLVQTELIPGWARGVGGWLAVNPWRVLVPVSSIVYAVCRIGYGVQFRDFILELFGGFK